MSHAPEVKTPDDLLPWAIAHRASSAERWEQQRCTNKELHKDVGALEERIRCVERMAAKWSAFAALFGGAVGAGVAQLIRYALSH